MAVPSVHFDIIAANVFRPFAQIIKNQTDHLQIEFELDPLKLKHHIQLKYTYFDTEQNIKIVRSVTVSEIDLEDNFTVELEEARAEPYYTVMRRKDTYNADVESRMEFLYRQLNDFLTKDIKSKHFPTVELVEHLNSLRSWGGGNHAELYLEGDEFGDDWRIRLVDPATKKPYIEHLPANISGLMVQILHNTYNRAHRLGQIEGINRMAERLASDEAARVIQASLIRNYEVDPRLSEFIHSASLSTIGKQHE